MKLLLLVALCVLPLRAQITITASRQGDEITLQTIGTIPRTMTPYSVRYCNAGAERATVYTEAVIQAIERKGFAVQDGAWVEAAARTYKAGGGKNFLLDIGVFAAKGFPVAAGFAAVVERHQEKAKTLVTPVNWWRADAEKRVDLEPGKCADPLLLALGGRTTDRTIETEVLSSKEPLQVQPNRPVVLEGKFWCDLDEDCPAVTNPNIVSTHPQEPTTAAEKLAAMRAADVEFWERALGVSQ